MGDHSAEPGRRRRRRSPQRSPSSAVLSLLAVLASASTSPAGSLSLSFLCPQVQAKHNVPDKYEQAEDGMWYQAESYTLYGSTLCKSCADTQQLAPSPTGDAPDTEFDILDSLPPGWRPQDSDQSRTSLILALSLVLAFFICFFIIGCMFWRNHVRKKRARNEDIEMTASLTRPRTSHQDAQVKAKLWAKASARWRANARHSARRRRGKRVVPKPPSVIDVPSSPTPSTPELRSTDSAVSSPRSSVLQLPLSVPVISQSALPPPAYRQQSLAPPSSAVQTPLIPSSTDASTSASDHHDIPSMHAAHVATDDKSLLRHLSSLASSPPRPSSEPPLSTPPPHLSSSAPEWPDEDDLQDQFPPDASERSCSSDAPEPSSIWPAPPSKGKMVAHYPYDYEAYHFEDDISGLEPEAQPSAPPFMETDALPSAPPFLLDDDPPPPRPSSPLHSVSS